MEDSVVRLLAEALKLRLLQNADILLTQKGPFPVIDIVKDLTIERSEPELIYEGVDGVGIFLQTITATSDCTLRLNRLDGPTYNPNEESIYIGEPVRKLWLSNKAGTGILKLRIHTNPTSMLTVTPERLVTDFFYRDPNGTRQALALESTLQAVLQKLTNIDANTDQLEGFVDQLEGYVDQLESLVTNTNTYVDQVESLLTTLNTYVDGLEGLISTLNTYVDQLEGMLDGVEGLLTNIDTNTKGQRTTGVSKQENVTTTSLQLGANVVPRGGFVRLWADADNTAEVAINIGAPAVVGTHAGLKKGQGIELEVDNTNRIYLTAATGTQKINWIVMT